MFYIILYLIISVGFYVFMVKFEAEYYHLHDFQLNDVFRCGIMSMFWPIGLLIFILFVYIPDKISTWKIKPLGYDIHTYFYKKKWDKKND
jgi:hypothetical protein